MNLLLLLLQNALADPHQVPNLLLLKLDVCIERPKVHLPLKCQLEHLNVPLIECVINGPPVRPPCRMNVPDGGVLGEELQDTTKLVLVSDVAKHGSPRGVEVAKGRVESLSVRGPHGWLVKRCAEGVERDVDGVGVGADLEEVAHDGSGLPPKAIDKLREVLNPVLDKAGFYDLDLDLLENVRHLTPRGRLIEEEGEVRPDRGVNQHCLVEVLVAARRALESGDGSHRAFLEHSKRVALSYELVDVAATEGAFEKEHDVFDHVLIGDEVKEGGEGLDGLRAEVLEFSHQLLHGRLL
mmetsp:Transcript_9545/g.20728  ORF Transcript_9545/g.20728 Transcript_9545/m.20728 type:complete len:296 (-) Transcript_9545:327-1214(-)